MDIRYKDVICGYAKNASVLSEVNFSCRPGEILCVLGKNGIGKTTLIRALFEKECLIDGTIFINGKSVRNMKVQELSQKVSYVPQARKNTFAYLVEDVILMGRAVHVGMFQMPDSKDYELVSQTMDRLGIGILKGKIFSNLSGGEQQLVMIARAMVQETQYIVFDEPESNLDFKNQKVIMNIIKELAEEGKGIIVISHKPDFAIFWNATLMLIFEDRTSIYGPLSRLLVEENLRKVYGVEMKIIDVENKMGKIDKFCKLG